MFKSSTSPITILLVAALALATIPGCGAKDNQAKQPKTYPIKATVSSIDAKKPAVTLDHEAIPGLMQAMEMEFPVADAKLLEGLATGDKVTGELSVGGGGAQTITRLSKQP